MRDDLGAKTDALRAKYHIADQQEGIEDFYRTAARTGSNFINPAVAQVPPGGFEAFSKLHCSQPSGESAGVKDTDAVLSAAQAPESLGKNRATDADGFKIESAKLADKYPALAAQPFLETCGSAILSGSREPLTIAIKAQDDVSPTFGSFISKIYQTLCPSVAPAAPDPNEKATSGSCGDYTPDGGNAGTVSVTLGMYQCTKAKELLKKSFDQLAAAQSRSATMSFDGQSWACGASGAFDPYSCTSSSGQTRVQFATASN